MDPVSKAQSPQNRRKAGFRPEMGKATQFQKGVSGNPGGKPKKKPITAIFEELFDTHKSREEIKKQVAETLTSRGMAGVLLLREAAERIEGKVKEEIELHGTVTLEQVAAARKRAGK